MSFGDAGEPGTFKNRFYRYMPNMFRRYWGVRFGPGTIGALYDYCMKGVFEAVRSPYIPHYDALRRLGNEQSMPQYPLETWTQYKDRLFDAWDTWGRAGDEGTITGQLAAAGNPGAQIFRYTDNGSWSEFFVFYPFGTTAVTDYDWEWTDGTLWGDRSQWGPNNITGEQLQALKDCITHWKPARWKCVKLVFETSGWTWGTGHTWGEADLVWGGTQVETTVQI